MPFVGFQIYLQLNCILGFANPAPGKELMNNWRAQVDKENELWAGGFGFQPLLSPGKMGDYKVSTAMCHWKPHSDPTLLRDSLRYSWTTLPWKAVEGRLRGTERSEADWILCVFHTRQHPSPLILLCSKEKNSLLEPGTGKDLWRYKKNLQELSLDAIFLQISAHAALNAEQGQPWSLCTPTQGSSECLGAVKCPKAATVEQHEALPTNLRHKCKGHWRNQCSPS